MDSRTTLADRRGQTILRVQNRLARWKHTVTLLRHKLLAAKATEPYVYPGRRPGPTPPVAAGSVWCWVEGAEYPREGRGYPLAGAECTEIAALRHALFWAAISGAEDGACLLVRTSWSGGLGEFEIELRATDGPSAWGMRARIVEKA